jgi:hypothetical protein
MFRVLTVILFLTCCNASFAQTDEQLKQYYSCIYQAEQHIIKKEYADAAKQYEHAANAGISMFAIDAFNAALCTAHGKDYGSTSVYARKLLLKDAELSFFASRPEFNDLLKSATTSTTTPAPSLKI